MGLYLGGFIIGRIYLCLRFEGFIFGWAYHRNFTVYSREGDHKHKNLFIKGVSTRKNTNQTTLGFQVKLGALLATGTIACFWLVFDWFAAWLPFAENGQM